MNPITKILLALLALSAGTIVPSALMTSAASAQQRTFYDSRGNVVGRSATDSQGTTTSYDSRGLVINRETVPGGATGNTTTISPQRESATFLKAETSGISSLPFMDLRIWNALSLDIVGL